MKSTKSWVTTGGGSFLQLFRLIFVLFSLYLLRDVFFVWDGFKFYASFPDFIPAVALVSVLWTIVAFLLTIFVWLIFRSIEILSDRAGFRIGTEHILLYGVFSLLFGVLLWRIKRLFWPDLQTGNQFKLIVFICLAVASLYLVRLFRDKAERWFKIAQERITPLVWLFGISVTLSVPLVSYYAWGKDSYKPIPQKFAQSAKSESHKKRPNIVLVTFDALTAEDMSLYGYERDTAPFINKWAKEAAVFTRAESGSNHTSPATASLMTGKRVWTHQLFQQGGFSVKSNIESLPKELKRNGYFNVAFVVNPWASTVKLNMLDSFDISPLATDFYETDNIVTFDGDHPGAIDIMLYEMFGDKIKKYDWIMEDRLLGILLPLFAPHSKITNPEYTKTAVPPEKTFNSFLEIYESLPEPFFAWIHVFPPHAHYLPPKPYRGMFGPYMPPERFKGFILDNDPQNMHDTRILYDEFIRYCDRQFEEFINQIEKQDKLKNTTVILSADHGESFQHDVYGHGVPELYEQLTHVPLIIKELGSSNVKVINDVTEQIDIPATILELAQVPVPVWMEGRSLVPLMRGEELPPRPAFSMFFRFNRSCGHKITKGTIAVWEGDYKLIYYLEENKSLLYNLKHDPEELNNLIDSEPEIGKRLLNLIKTNLEKANKEISSKG